MYIDAVTIFPDYFAPLQLSLIGKAQENGILDIQNIVAEKKNGYVLKGRMRVGTILNPTAEKLKPEMDFHIENGDFAILHDIWPEATRAKGVFHSEFKMEGENGERHVS